VNPWLVALAILLSALLPCAVASFRGTAIERLVALEMSGMVETMLLILLAEWMHQAILYDLALALAFLTFGSGLVFARFLERWL
jgi:multicomponent Na+:H+ antiporter subunit F